MNHHIRGLSQRSRLTEFIINESGAMSAQKAAQMGAILATSMLAGLLMHPRTAAAECAYPCMNDENCVNLPPFCRNIWCDFGTPDQHCDKHCTWDSVGNCVP